MNEVLQENSPVDWRGPFAELLAGFSSQEGSFRLAPVRKFGSHGWRAEFNEWVEEYWGNVRRLADLASIPLPSEGTPHSSKEEVVSLFSEMTEKIAAEEGEVLRESLVHPLQKLASMVIGKRDVICRMDNAVGKTDHP